MVGKANKPPETPAERANKAKWNKAGKALAGLGAIATRGSKCKAVPYGEGCVL